MPAEARRLTNKDRKPIHVFVDPDTHEAWRGILLEEGVQDSAFVEGALRAVIDGGLDLGVILKEARQVMAERKARS